MNPSNNITKPSINTATVLCLIGIGMIAMLARPSQANDADEYDYATYAIRQVNVPLGSYGPIGPLSHPNARGPTGPGSQANIHDCYRYSGPRPDSGGNLKEGSSSGRV